MLKIFKSIRIIPSTRRSVVNIRWFSDDDSSDDERKKKDEAAKKKSNDALKRLNFLLENMTATSTQAANVVSPKNMRQKFKEDKKKAVEEATDLKTITHKIAEKIGGDTQKTEAELLSVLLGTSSENKSSLNEIIGGLKVESEKSKLSASRAQMVKNALKQQQQQRPWRQVTETRRPREVAEKKVIVNLFDAKPLHIFDKVTSTVPDPLETWSKLEQRELKMAVTHPPRNYFEKMILWTEQGKIWKFPIDNEQGMDEEKSTDFTEHVMLEMHLEGWCPSKGPIRHFMELVCVGLGKNNFLSAKEKKDHIMWYKEYFESKKDVLGELLTLSNENVEQQKQIES